MIARHRFARPQIELRPSAVLTAVAVAREKECVRNLAAEAAGNVNEASEPDDRGTRNSQPLGADDTIVVGLDDLRLSIYDKTKRPTKRDHRQRLKRSIQCKTADYQAHPPVRQALPNIQSGTRFNIGNYNGRRPAWGFGL